MSQEIVVTPNKNVFLAYALLDVIGQGPIYNSHPLRKKTLEHIEKFKQSYRDGRYLPNIEIHALVLNEAPDFSKKRNVILSPTIKTMIEQNSHCSDALKMFYKTVHFEEFYQGILPVYQSICDDLLNSLSFYKNLNEDLNNTWELKEPFTKDVVIPMPLEETRGGSGPSIGDTAYQIIGPPFDATIIDEIIHEASHPRMERSVTEPLQGEIEKRRYLLGHVLANPFYPPQYGRRNWRGCFEEHFIRAMQISFFEISDCCKPLKLESERISFNLIDQFYYEIEQHRQYRKGSLQEVAVRILDKLDKEYKDKPVPPIYEP